MHCAEPGCLIACPAPGAIVQYANGIVDFQQDQCIGCGYCMTGCPFNVPKFAAETRRVYKCTLCVDRVAGGLAAGVRQGVSDELPAVRHQGRHAGGREHARRATQGQRVSAGGGLRSARRRRHRRGHGAGVRRSAGAVRPAAQSVGAARGAVLEGRAQVDSATWPCSAACWSRRSTTFASAASTTSTAIVTEATA